ncbi:MAG: glycosyltransferase family 4 protein [Nitrospinae bacterium]|nr:glycosyltransferase family 4 protein [Nitrospinota bacterium]
MQIGLVKRTFRLQGGGERQVAYLIEGLLARGHQVHLLTQQPPAGRPVQGLSWQRVPACPLPPALRALSFALGVRASIRRAGLALVQSFDRTLGQHIYRAGEGVHREWLARKRSTLRPLARGWSYVRPVDRVILALERRIFTRTPTIITNSLQAKHDIMRHYGTQASRMTVIYNGVDHERFHPGVRARFRAHQRAAWGVSAAEVVLLTVGSGFHRKGLGYLVQALGELRKHGILHVRAVVVGKGRIGRYQRLAAKLGVADWVRFTGLSPEVERYYAAADVFVLPTLYDPFANACLEAMACGVPVLTSEANGAAELLQDGVNGCVLKHPLRPEGLVESLRSLLPEERRRMLAEAGYRTACEYPLAHALDQTLRLYESVVGRPGYT